MSNPQIRSNVAHRFDTRRGLRGRWLAALTLAASSLLGLAGCSHTPSAEAPEQQRESAAEQAIVNRSAAAFERLRQNPRFARMDSYLERARAVLIFPRLVKASLIVGGEGGNGVLVARQADGSWSPPAFYSLGAPSVGLQIGYQQATVVLFVMDEKTLERTLHSSVALGAKSGATIGDIEDDATLGDVFSANIYQVVDADGVFAGVSLDGYVIGSRARRNLAYYGKPVTPRVILLEGAAHKPEADVLARALAPRPVAAGPAVSSR